MKTAMNTRRAAAENPAPALDARGLIDDCDQTAERMFGYRREQLLGQPVSMVLPELQGGTLYQAGRINPGLLYRSHIGAAFRARPCADQGFACLLFLTNIGSVSSPHIRVVLRRLAATGGAP